MLAVIKVVIIGWACHLVAAQDNSLGMTQTNPGSSCNDIYENNDSTRGVSGYYWIDSTTTGIHQVYCDMEQECGGHKGGWMRIADLDAVNSEYCPSGWSHITDPVSACIATDSNAGCHSANFSTFSIPYSRVCGRVVGWQDGWIDGFAALDFPSRSINGPYVDGVSITYGTPRKHIWTNAIGNSESANTARNCPCSAFPGPAPPSFVQDNYYCESGSPYADPEAFLSNDDLVWDGDGCPDENSCCSNPSMPWFFRQLPLPTDENIEARICRDEPSYNEDILLAEFYLYVL